MKYFNNAEKLKYIIFELLAINFSSFSKWLVRIKKLKYLTFQFYFGYNHWISCEINFILSIFILGLIMCWVHDKYGNGSVRLVGSMGRSGRWGCPTCLGRQACPTPLGCMDRQTRVGHRARPWPADPSWFPSRFNLSLSSSPPDSCGSSVLIVYCTLA